jgi:hypothetical protein
MTEYIRLNDYMFLYVRGKRDLGKYTYQTPRDSFPLSQLLLLRRPGMFGLVAYDFFLFYPEESKGEMDILDIIIGTHWGAHIIHQ